MSQNAIREYACEPEERQFINTENATVVTKDGSKRNGDLLYTIRPIQFVRDQFYKQ